MNERFDWPKYGVPLSFFVFTIIFSSMSFAGAENENWNFSESQRWIGDSAEGSVEFCKEKSIRWDSPQLGFDINQDSIDDFMVAISCYQGEAPQDGGKHAGLHRQYANLDVSMPYLHACSQRLG